MGNTKQTSFKKSNVISASEISQYVYCPMSWYLQHCGYEPQSPALAVGKKAHTDLGNTIDSLQIEGKQSRWCATIGYLLAGIALLLILAGVFL